MKRLIVWASRLYPARWRARYGAEFAALLENVRPSWKDVWDVIWDAAKTRLRGAGPWKTAALFGAGGALVGTAAGLVLLPNRCIALARANLTIVCPPGTFPDYDAEQAMLAAIRRIEARTQPFVLAPEFGRDVAGRAESVVLSSSRLERRVKDRPYPVGLEFRFEDRDRAKARTIVSTLLVRALAETRDAVANIPFGEVKLAGDWIHEPAPSSPRRVRLAFQSALVGLGVWAVWFALSRLPIWKRRGVA